MFRVKVGLQVARMRVMQAWLECEVNDFGGDGDIEGVNDTWHNGEGEGKKRHASGVEGCKLAPRSLL